MIPLSATETVPVEVGGVTYTLAVPTLLSRAAYRREVAAMGAVYHTDQTMLDVLRDGIKACVVDKQQGELLEVINSFEIENKQVNDLGSQASDEDRESLKDLDDRIADIQRFMQREYDKYAELAADRGYWLSVAPIIAFRMFVTGWEGDIDLVFKQRRGQVCESIMNHLPADHIELVGWRAIALMSPNGAEQKNSDSPSTSE